MQLIPWALGFFLAVASGISLQFIPDREHRDSTVHTGGFIAFLLVSMLSIYMCTPHSLNVFVLCVVLSGSAIIITILTWTVVDMIQESKNRRKITDHKK